MEKNHVYVYVVIKECYVTNSTAKGWRIMLRFSYIVRASTV